MLEEKNRYRVIWVHGRPSSHPMQMKMAQSIGSDFIPVDFKLRWHDVPNASKFRIYISWLVCALTFPNVRKYDFFFAGGAHAILPLMKALGVIRGKQKIVLHLGDEMLYSIYSGRFSKNKTTILKYLITRYDAIVCEGQMGKDIIKETLKYNLDRVYVVPQGMENKHIPNKNSRISPLNKKSILFIGQGPNKMRFWYKGIDILLKAFNEVYKKDSEFSLTIIGDWNPDDISIVTNEFSQDVKNAIKLIPFTPNLFKYIEQSSLYLHPARGEAYGITILISMASGLPTMVSEWTGAKEVVEKVSKELIVPLDPIEISNRILWYHSISPEQIEDFSILSSKVGLEYNESNILSKYKDTFDIISKDLLSNHF